MMPKIIKKRAGHKEGSEERLRDTVEDMRARLKERQRILIIGLVIFAVLLVSVGAFVVYNKSQRDKAAQFRMEAYKYFYGENITPPATAAGNYKKALELFRKSYDLKKKADVLLYIAYCQYELGGYDDAINTLKELNEKFSEPLIIPLSYYKLSEAYIRKGDSTSALAALNTLATIKDGIFHDMALMESGKILESQGKADEANARYKELITKFPNSALAGEAKARLGE